LLAFALAINTENLFILVLRLCATAVNMEIRQATDQDIPAIVQLLKISLGESLMPKSEAFWRWKNIDNPFGKSPVLLAFENEQLIGVRAFMRWEWKQGDKIYKAVRAVDTATHPQHQGKGIFKTLTLQLVEQCRAEGIDFIFNTPNKSSKPGYLKMGWMSQGKMKLVVKPVLHFRESAKDFEATYAMNNVSSPMSEWNKKPSVLSTNVSSEFLNWRYVHSPNITYYAFSNHTSSPYVTIFRLKPFRWGTEFRICEEINREAANQGDYTRQLMSVARASGANLITSASALRVFPELSLPIGPEITTRALSFDHNFLTFNFWKPTLGDMEVF
jgi:N-acetylglutamate synthase-like GNAT family acetyltransferase